MDDRVELTEPGDDSAPLSPESPLPRRSRVRSLVILGILLVAFLAAGGYWWTRPASQPAGRRSNLGFQSAPQPVGAATVDKGDIRIVLNELGTVTSLDTVTVLTQINGQLTEVGFKEGQIVKKGDFLAQIDPRPYQVALEQAQGQLAHDQGLLLQAQTDLKRYQTLGRQDSIAQQQVDDQRFLVAQYTGSVQSDQGQVDSAKLNLTYCHIVSPIDGQVGLRQVDPGNYVQTSTASGLVVITQMQPISVIFSVPEDNLPDIPRRLHAGATLSVDAYDRANLHKLASGQLATPDNQIDTTTGTVKLRAIFANQDGLLYPNQFVNAALLVDTMHDTVRVPVPAVQRGEPGTFAYVIGADGTVSVRPLTLGPADGGYVAVLSGLQPGERVVTDGTDRLRDGAAVTVPAPAQSQSEQHGGWQDRHGQPGQRPDGQHRHPPPASPGSPPPPASGGGDDNRPDRGPAP